MKWYVIFVKSGNEDIVKSWLDYHFNKEDVYSIIPKRKIREKKQNKVKFVLKTIFPGYIFLHTNINLKKYKTISNIPHVIKFLNTGEYYSSVDEKEISPILQLIEDNGIIDLSKIFVKNSTLIVKEGPLLGMEDIIKKIDKHKRRAKILLELMGESKTVDVGIELLERCE